MRLARLEDLAALSDVERAAGAAFRELGMAAVADDEPATVEAMLTYQRDGRAWVDADVPDQLPAGLRRIREHEAELGLDTWPRVAMRRALTD
ncbi:hypothetical protein FQ377_02205 [Arthrobacter echini]|uniref:GNAT family N-acetyltransferase n=2 Tax=Arthrobacter echini TaxID=1529066 RepID=A0A5D0XVP8_9MICC|nr:hypothetical protein [Arthrobacter echini]TYD00749.1 hypothetical protein FQ377_02205 [Arthrobacter echini]